MWPKDYGRFNVFFDKHFGVGVRWDSTVYPVELSVSLPFITFTFGVGRKLF